MPFRPRNPYYLRISKRDVLPIYLYLDDRHLDWMTDTVLQHVLEDLRPKVLPKLQAEADANLGPGGPPSAKKATVETHRGENYQFCYFLRKTQPHSVVLKTRTYAAAPPQKQLMMPPPPVPEKARKRKSKTALASRKKQKTKGKGRAIDDSESEAEADSSGEEAEEDENASGSRTSTRSRKRTATVDVDGDSRMEDDDSPDDDEYIPTSRKKGKERAKTIHFELEIEDDEEEKPKPLLHLKHQGFKILGSCLCIVVEPWPAIQAPSPRTVDPSIGPRLVTSNEIARARSKTPLFLPDPDDRDRSQTPFPDASHVRPLPLYDDDLILDGGMDEDEYGGMIEFSQILNAAGDVRAGALDEDEDMEGAVFFGDADEVREL
ncbi:hypothetical protein BT96DRAFT_957990 [Gymnopus androsaceus JB14]|uniref:Uncharacterized protein n=1 Tax=Gymnopus androsaceus JB14 TaxID=1447944 RepID=A0A6A4HJ35_9AGAR|nr:hypothetical protein BT96DRAFT_957990 [Gymnopus androsaceus JB14]